MASALDGVKVLDLSNGLAGPLSATYLGDQGADVIRVERPLELQPSAGSPNDRNAGVSFIVANRNKREIAVDITRPKGLEIILKLASISDVLLHNFRPGVAERLGMGYEALHKLNPRLIYAHLTAFGTKGPYAQRPGYDLLTQSLSGILNIRPMPDGSPNRSGLLIADNISPALVAYGVTLALLAREKTGEGQKVETSLLNAAVAIQATALVKTEQARRTTPMASYQAPWAPYRCSDGRFLHTGVTTDKEWVRLCKALGLEKLLEDPRFLTNKLREENNDALLALFTKVFASKPRDQWMAVLLDHDVPSAPILTRDEVFTHPQFLENGMLAPWQDDIAGKTLMMGMPVNLSSTPGSVRRSAPGYGQHTGEVLVSLGYTPMEIEALKAESVIVLGDGL